MSIKPGVKVEYSDNNDNNFNVFVVYLINCTLNRNWAQWIKIDLGLLKDLKCTVYVTAIINTGMENDVAQKIKEVIPNAIIEFYYENEYEYRGILRVWELSQTHNDHNDILLYYHSKNITRRSSPDPIQDPLKRLILDNSNILKIFSKFKSINKIGTYCSELGWIWYNYWYVRGSYACMVERPIKTSRRHYYEDWLGRKVDDPKYLYPSSENEFAQFYKQTNNDCYNMNYDGRDIYNIGSYYAPLYRYVK